MPPKSTRKADLRACLICSVIQPFSDFVEAGCPNCEEILEMRSQPERVAECTSINFDGMIAMMKPEESWVAKWQRINRKEAGLYAARVTGRPPPDVIEAIEAKGGTYRPRDEVEE